MKRVQLQSGALFALVHKREHGGFFHSPFFFFFSFFNSSLFSLQRFTSQSGIQYPNTKNKQNRDSLSVCDVISHDLIYLFFFVFM